MNSNVLLVVYLCIMGLRMINQVWINMSKWLNEYKMLMNS
jgi:hypothetical protein